MIITGKDNSIISIENIEKSETMLIDGFVYKVEMLNFYDANISEGFSVGDYYDGVSFLKKEAESVAIPVPQTITKLQAMKQMKAIGKWEAFKAVLASDEDVNDEWLLSDNLNRTYPLVLGIGQLFGFTDDDMDGFFIEASKL